MNEDNRHIATALIWLGAGFGIGLSNVNSGDLNFYNAVISLAIAFGAIVATVVMWRGAEYFKAKRDHAASDDYTNLLVQLMTHEERQALRSRLINTAADDGEIFAPEEDRQHSAS